MKNPDFPFFSKDFYEGTRMMLPEERACYVDLLIYQHQNGAIPNDFKRLKLYCTGIEVETIEQVLKSKFKLTAGGWINVKLDSVIKKEEAEELVLSSPVPRTRKPQKARFDFRQSLLNMGAKPVFVNGWMEVRKAKKGANSEAAFSLFYDQVVKSGKDINYVLKKCIEKNWCGFSAEWIKDEIPLSLNKIPDLFEGYEKL